VQARWGILLLPPMVLSLLLFSVPQLVFLRMSLFRDLGLGRLGAGVSLSNYLEFIGDPFYLKSLALTINLSAIVAALALVLGFPVAYVLARMRSGWASLLLATVVISSFVTVVVKVLGLVIIFSANGPLNRTLTMFGLIDTPLRLLGNRTGVVIGLLHYTLALVILMLFSIIQTIPRSLEESAQVHGASRWRVFYRVVLPLSLPALIAGGLIVFNMSMGAFTSAALLGGGRVLTLPVLIQRTIILETRYGMGAALAAILLVVVLLINVASVAIVTRLAGPRRRMAT
jgi:putative spermidine/putrescine transport system permease protein